MRDEGTSRPTMLGVFRNRGKAAVVCGEIVLRPGDVVSIEAVQEDMDSETVVMLSLPTGGFYGFTPLSNIEPLNVARVLPPDNDEIVVPQLAPKLRLIAD